MAEASPKPGIPAPQSNGTVVPHQLSWSRRLLASLIYGLIRLVTATMRFRFEDQTRVFETEPLQPVIFCVWHNRLAVMLTIYRKHPQHLQPARRLAAMVSASKDGAVVARILEHFGVQPVRGSSSRRGAQALLELTTWAERGSDLAITPDGPRGPRYALQEGVIALAQLTGLPVVPVSCHLNWKICLNSWDRFQVPLPFARCVAGFGEPLRVAREADEPERERLRQHLEERLRALTKD